MIASQHYRVLQKKLSVSLDHSYNIVYTANKRGNLRQLLIVAISYFRHHKDSLYLQHHSEAYHRCSENKSTDICRLDLDLNL